MWVAGPCPGCDCDDRAGGARDFRMCVRILSMMPGSVMSAITRKVPPHNGHLEMSAVREANCLADCLAISHRSSKVLFRRSAQDIPSGLVRVLRSCCKCFVKNNFTTLETPPFSFCLYTTNDHNSSENCSRLRSLHWSVLVLLQSR